MRETSAASCSVSSLSVVLANFARVRTFYLMMVWIIIAKMMILHCATLWPRSHGCVFKSLRFHSFRPVHTTPILLRFQIFPLWRAFSKVCVFTENDTSFSCGRDGTWKRNKMFAFSNENASVWTGPWCSLGLCLGVFSLVATTYTRKNNSEDGGLETFVYVRVHSCTFVYICVRWCTFVYVRVRSCTFVYLRVPSCTFVYLRVPSCTFGVMLVLWELWAWRTGRGCQHIAGISR